MECFYRKKGGARKTSAKYIEGSHLLFLVGGRNYKGFFFSFFLYKGFYHTDTHTHTHTHNTHTHTHLLSLDQGQEWRRNKMQQITTTLPTQKFQTS